MPVGALDGQRIALQNRLDPAVDEDQLDVGLGDERSEQRPVARRVHQRLPDRAARRDAVCPVEEPDVRIASALVRPVRPQVAAVPGSHVAEPGRRRIREPPVHGAEDLCQSVHRLPGGVREIRPLDDPGRVLRHLHRVDDPSPVREPDGYAPERRQVIPELPCQVLVGQLPRIEEGGTDRLGGLRFSLFGGIPFGRSDYPVLGGGRGGRERNERGEGESHCGIA